jgi:hypothetical protein
MVVLRCAISLSHGVDERKVAQRWVIDLSSRKKSLPERHRNFFGASYADKAAGCYCVS